MAKPRFLGEIVIDPMFRGFKVTAQLFNPLTGQPVIVGTDQFSTIQHARSFADQLRNMTGHEIVDKTRSSAG